MFIIKKIVKITACFLLICAIMGIDPMAYSHISPDTQILTSLIQKKQIQEKENIAQSLEMLGLRFDEKENAELVNLIYTESREQNIDPQLIVALIKIESEFKKEALSPADAKGLMQLRFETAQEIAGEIGIKLDEMKLSQPGINIKLGTYYLAKLLKRFDDIELALAAYNIGPTKVTERISSNKKIGKNFSGRVLRVYEGLI